MIKKLLALGICAAAVLSGVNIMGEPVIEIDGEAINSKTIVSNNSVYVPLRTVFENMGCSVSWNDETKTASIAYDGRNIEFKADDGIIEEERLYVPLRKISESLGFEVKWDGENKTISIDNSDKSFAYRLKEYMPTDKNYVFSPLSVKYALAMAANGADEGVKAELTKALGIGELDKYNEEVKSYIDKCKFGEMGGNGLDDKRIGVNLNIANSLWLNTDYINGGAFSENFKRIIKNKYDGEAQTVRADEADEKINDWCSDKTNGKINKIIDDNDFLACIVNAVYFNGKWQSEFYKQSTHKDTFYSKDGKKSKIDFMTQTDKFDYYADDKVQIVAMPYSASRISMYIMMSDDLADFEDYADKLENKKVELTVPKFKVEYSADIADILTEMGAGTAFEKDDSTPHFTPMFNDVVNDNMNVYISKALHKAYISVDEEGTEAAAVTALTMCGTTAMPEPEPIYEFKADRPFTYVIRDDSNGEILFMGEYAFAD